MSEIGKRVDERLDLYNRVCIDCSRATTRAYSTSFSLSIRMLAPDIRDDIYAIYGFVRLADEIVDSFHGHDRTDLLARLSEDTFRALDDGISFNPILQSFCLTFNRYGLDRLHVEQFLRSMEWDLDRTNYDRTGYDSYIVGSAEAVGLMCLKVFVRGDEAEYQRLEPSAVRLGAAFQKVNFLRDMREDVEDLGRIYFPDLDVATFDDEAKQLIESEIEADLESARRGIADLPRDVRFGVFLAYTYYGRLLRRIRRLSSQTIRHTRVRVPDLQKAFLLVSTFVRHRLNRI